MSNNILEEILEHKRLQVEEAKLNNKFAKSDLAKMKNEPFLKLFRKGKLSIIAEVKKASPSKGVIREDFNPVEIAQVYEKAGASAISVLTDEVYFQGSLNYLQDIKKELTLPLLRKDFIIDTYQIEEACAAGASAVLLIVAALNKIQLKEYIKTANNLSLTSLVEVHDEEEVEIALSAGAKVIGINNRNLKTFKTDLKQTEKLVKLMPDDIIIISESGINTPEDVRYLKALNIDGVLIGEAFMRERDIAKKFQEMLEEA